MEQLTSRSLLEFEESCEVMRCKGSCGEPAMVTQVRIIVEIRRYHVVLPSTDTCEDRIGPGMGLSQDCNHAIKRKIARPVVSRVGDMGGGASSVWRTEMHPLVD